MNRLDEIEENKILNVDGITGKLQSIELTPEQYAYLFGQAERVESLLKTVDMVQLDEERLSRKYKTISREKRRYKQTLEFYADGDNYKTVVKTEKEIMFLRMSQVQDDGGHKARQALKEGEIK